MVPWRCGQPSPISSQQTPHRLPLKVSYGWFLWIKNLILATPELLQCSMVYQVMLDHIMMVAKCICSISISQVGTTFAFTTLSIFFNANTFAWSYKSFKISQVKVDCRRSPRMVIHAVNMAKISNHSVYASSQWEMTLHCNAIPHWLGAYTVYASSQWEMVLHCNALSHWLGAYTAWSLQDATDLILGIFLWGEYISKRSFPYSVSSFLPSESQAHNLLPLLGTQSASFI